jgi:DNA polymerase-4
MPAGRTILHVDMDAFFASVEQRDDASLRGQPVLVAGRPPRGVVQAASYEARVFGCRSAMPTAQAVTLCPHARIVKGRFAAYREASDAVFAILRDFTPLVQPLSIDEAFLDVTGSDRLFGDGPTIAREIRRRVAQAVGLTCSVGVAPNKFLAKLASDLDKPDGLTVIPPDRVEAVLAPLPVAKLWGVGPAMQRTLARFGVHTIGDLRGMPEDFFRRNRHTARLRDLAFGRDDRPVATERVAKSIGSEQTFGEDIGTLAELERVLLGQVEHVAGRLRVTGRRAGCVTIKLRHGASYSRFVTFTRRRSVQPATDRTDLLWSAAAGLLRDWAARDLRPLRLLGVSLGDLDRPETRPQLDLFPDPADARQTRVDAAVDQVRTRLGHAAIRRGV